MALGGVATGSIKAQEAAIVAGSIIIIGGMFKLIEITAIIGNMVVATAVFEVNSVMKITEIVTTKIRPKG